MTLKRLPMPRLPLQREHLQRSPLRLATPLRLLPLLCALSACAVGPDFKSPAAPATDSFTKEALPAQTESVAIQGGEAQSFSMGKAVPTQWWTLFGSDQLNQLVVQAFKGSPTVDSAHAALRQAKENLNAERGNFFPTLDAGLGAEREKISLASLGEPGGGTEIFNVYNASVNVAYTLDLFGGVRRAVEAQAAQVDYQQFQLQATYQTLAANVVTSAIAEASLRAQVLATNDIIDALEHQLRITEAQFQLGSISNSEVLSARSNLATVRATLPALDRQLSAAQNQLAVYLGQLPSQRVSTDFELAQLTLPQDLPLSLPSNLVRQRPDVRAAEAQLHQASAQVGVATANLFPQLSISGSYGSQAATRGDLFNNDVWNIGANLTAPLFHGGTLTAQRRASIAAYDQAFADYRRTVLVAFQNVADSLRAIETDAAGLKAQFEATTAAEQSLRLTETQYKLGGISYLNLLSAQQQYQQTRISYVQALAARYQDTAALFQALGGGGINESDNATASAAVPEAAPAATPAPNPTPVAPAAAAQ